LGFFSAFSAAAAAPLFFLKPVQIRHKYKHDQTGKNSDQNNSNKLTSKQSKQTEEKESYPVKTEAAASSIELCHGCKIRDALGSEQLLQYYGTR